MGGVVGESLPVVVVASSPELQDLSPNSFWWLSEQIVSPSIKRLNMGDLRIFFGVEDSSDSDPPWNPCLALSVNESSESPLFMAPSYNRVKTEQLSTRQSENACTSEELEKNINLATKRTESEGI